MIFLGRSAVGIDVSDGTLKAALLSRRGRHVTLHRTWRRPCDAAADPQAAALDGAAALLAEARLGAGTRVVLSVPTRGALSRTYLIPAMERARIAEMVRYEVLSEAGLPAEDLLIRHQVRRNAAEQQVYACALRRRDVDSFRAQLAARRIAPDELQPPGCALASFVDHELPRGHDRLLLGVGRLASELVVLAREGLWMRQLPLGLAHAEPAELARRLQQEIQSALAFFLPADRVFRPHELLLSEEGAMDAAFTGALRKVAGCPVSRVQSLQNIHASWRARHEGQGPEQALAMGQSLGLALCGLGLARFHLPILDPDPQREVLRQLPLVAAGVLVCALTLGASGLLAGARASELNATLPIRLEGELRDRAAQRDRVLDERDAVQSEAAALLAIARRRPAALQPRRALAALSALGSERGDQVLHVEQLWLATGEPDRPALMTLTLHAAPAFDGELGDRLLRALKAEFSEVQVSGPQPVPESGLSRWTVELSVP